MKNSQHTTRSFNLDIIRLIALVLIPSAHFFLYTGFYNTTVSSPYMYTAFFIRNLCLLGLSLFMLLTGYLQGNKEIPLNGKYFLKATKFIVPYLIITFFYLLVDLFYYKSEYYPEKTVETFTGFINYSWYVEMYLGLFLLIPFLNMIWSNLKDRKQEYTLLGILIGLSLLPSLINSYSFNDPEWWNASITDQWFLIPDWWESLYPITYYFTGAYLKKHKDEFKLKTYQWFLLFLASAVITNIHNLIRDYGNTPSIHRWLSHDSILLYIPAVFLFMFFSSISFKKPPTPLVRIVGKLSDLCYGAFLASKIADMVIYPQINHRLPSLIHRALAFPVILIAVLIISFALSFIADLIYKGSCVLIKKASKKQT